MTKLAYIALASTLLISFTVKAESLGERFTTFAGFQLGAVKLSDIQNKLGAVKLVETGDAGEYIASVCYATPDGLVLFLAGELDGPEHTLGGFGFAKKSERKPCGNWPATLAAPALYIGGLRLGITLKEFTNIVGTSVHVEGNKAYAFFESSRSMTKKKLLVFRKKYRQ